MKDKIYYNSDLNEYLLLVGKSDTRERTQSGEESLLVFKVIKWKKIFNSRLGDKKRVELKFFVLLTPSKLKKDYTECSDVEIFRAKFFGKESNRIKTKTELRYEAQEAKDLARLNAMSKSA